MTALLVAPGIQAGFFALSQSLSTARWSNHV